MEQCQHVVSSIIIINIIINITINIKHYHSLFCHQSACRKNSKKKSNIIKAKKFKSIAGKE